MCISAVADESRYAHCFILILLRQHRTIWQAHSAKDFASYESYKRAGILYVFPPFITARMGQKIGRRPQTQLCGAALGVLQSGSAGTEDPAFPISILCCNNPAHKKRGTATAVPLFYEKGKCAGEFHRACRGGLYIRPWGSGDSPQASRKSHPGTGGDKPRPYEKSGSVSVGAGFMPARGAAAIPEGFPTTLLGYGRP